MLYAFAQDGGRQIVDGAREERLGAGPLLGQAAAARARVQLVTQVDVDVGDGVAGPAPGRCVVVPRGGIVDAPVIAPREVATSVREKAAVPRIRSTPMTAPNAIIPEVGAPSQWPQAEQ